MAVDTASFGDAGAPVEWAAGKLREALAARGVTGDNARASVRVVASRVGGKMAREFKTDGVTEPETVALIPGTDGAVLATGVDARGVVYGLLELAERVRLGEDALLGLHLSGPEVETTPNKVRSCARAFCSEIEDKGWFYDRGFWAGYLDTLASSRFNRFNFALGFGWDFPRGVTGDYLHFPYPYLVGVPGFDGVRVDPPLAEGERERNLEMLKFLAAETTRRGMDFQLGIWTHAYQWTDSPNSDHRIVGLTPETHARYCRDALAVVLRECPQISGLTMRIHGESGIPEGSYDFWETLFQAISGAGRRIEIDMHAKGLDARMIDVARKTGMPLKAGAKFWAEHQGLGYHQADIRAAEYPRAGVTGTFALSSGSRQFTRYGYGDFYQQGTRVEVLYRVWPGTQRHLLWADPALASGYGRAAHFCGAAGMELCEPLTFKGREGSGRPGGRLAYADAGLADAGLDTGKFATTYRVWGRSLYSPGTEAEVHRRHLRSVFGPAATALEQALAESSKILPLVTTAWLPSASNHEFWPEMVTPVSILPVKGKPLYGDSPAPHNVSAVSPLDPQLFTTIAQDAKNVAAGAVDGRYSSREVIAWLAGMVGQSSAALTAARAAAGGRTRSAAFRRVEEDVLILNGLGAYYAGVFQAALLYSVQEATKDAGAAKASLAAYRRARDAWAAMAARASKVYAADVSYGSTPFRRGHWADRLPAIDADVAALEAYFGASAAGEPGAVTARALRPPVRPALAVEHAAPKAFRPGAELRLAVAAPGVQTAVLWYRHVNHAERWTSIEMVRAGGAYGAAIPGEYTGSPYPLQYYFELRTADGATLHPVLNATLSNQPYFAVYERS